MARGHCRAPLRVSTLAETLECVSQQPSVVTPSCQYVSLFCRLMRRMSLLNLFIYLFIWTKSNLPYCVHRRILLKVNYSGREFLWNPPGVWFSHLDTHMHRGGREWRGMEGGWGAECNLAALIRAPQHSHLFKKGCRDLRWKFLRVTSNLMHLQYTISLKCCHFSVLLYVHVWFISMIISEVLSSILNSLRLPF